MPSDGKNSHYHWQGELKNLETYLSYNNLESMNFKDAFELRCPIIVLCLISLTVSNLRLFQCFITHSLI